MKRIGVTSVTTLLAASLLALAATDTARPSASATDPCVQPGDTPVRMTTKDGGSIYGLEVGTGTTGVVFAHQYFSDHCEFMPLARELAGLGYRGLSIDLRGNGLSRTGRTNRLDLDVAAAVAHLRAEGVTRVKLVGASMGGAAVLVAGSWIRPAVEGVVSLSGPSYFRGMSALRAVQRSKVPMRFLVSRDDGSFASDATLLMRRAAARDKAILRYTAAGHGSAILSIPSAHAYVLAFLTR